MDEGNCFKCLGSFFKFFILLFKFKVIFISKLYMNRSLFLY